MGIEERIKEAGLEIPAAPSPAGSYVPVVVCERFAYVSGQLPVKDGQLEYKGKVGIDISPEDANEAAKICALNALACLKGELGSLEKIEKIVRVGGFVNSPEGFTSQPQVINGASDFLAEIFGEKGKHARAAVGVNELPLNAAVEVELIVYLKE